MRTRRTLVKLGLAGLGLLPAGCGPKAKPAGPRLPTIGYIQNTSSAVLEATRAGYLRGLAESGYVDGKTARILLRDAQGDMATGQLIARQFAGEPVDLIAAASTPSLQAALKATGTIPIVFCTVVDPVLAGAGRSAETHRPNVTGIVCADPVDQAVHLAHEILPDVKVMGTLHDPGEAFSEKFLESCRVAAKQIGLQWVEIAVTSTTDLVPGTQALKARGVQAIVQIPGSGMGAAIGGEIKAAGDLGIPYFSTHPSDLEKGGVAAVGWDFEQAGYEAGKLAARVLKGESPAGIPFQPVSKAHLVVNPEAAQRFRIVIPPAVLQRADRGAGRGG